MIDIKPIARIIKASAGTGKTYRISVEYIATLIRIGQYTGYARPDVFREILVITFTRKATSEIRERIFEHLDLIVRQKDGYIDLINNLNLETTLDSTQREFLARVLDTMKQNKHLLMIRTIDGFTQMIFQQLVAPALYLEDFTIVNENDEEVYQNVLERVIENPESMRMFRQVFQKYIHRGKDLSAYRNLVKSILENRWLFERPTLLESMGKTTDPPASYELYKRALIGFFKDIYEKEGKEAISLLCKKRLKGIFEANGIDQGNLEEGLLAALHHDELRIHAAKYAPDNTFFKKPNEMYGEKYVREVYTHLVKGVIEEVRKEEVVVREIAEIVFREYDHIKMTSREFTHSDILWYTYSTLHRDDLGFIDPDNGMVTNLFYEFLSQKIRYLFIDEFQDTSILQWKLLEPLLHEYASGSGVKEYGGFIVVGDEKQAIYGWRGGERELLDRIRHVFHGVEEETLDMSYRSQSVVIDFVNRYFGLISRCLEELEWAYNDVRHLPKKTAGYVQVDFDNYSARSKDDPREKAMCYQDFVNKVIAPAISPESKMPIPAGSAAILARSNADLNSIARALDEAGIPYIHESSEALSEHRLVKPLIHLLRYLAWFDYLDLLIFLRSDYIQLDNERLNRLLTWYRKHKDTQAEHDAGFFTNAVESITCDELKSLAAFLTNHQNPQTLFPALAEVVAEFGSTTWNPVDQRNLTRFLQAVVQYDQAKSDTGTGVYGFLNYLEKNAGDDGLRQVGLDEGDAIRLMTIHKSKGLQFETTFVFIDFSKRSSSAGLLELHAYYRMSEDSASPTELVLCNSEYDSLLKNCLTGVRGFPYEAIAKMMEHRKYAIFADEINALYVALTRAKNNLFVYAALEAADFSKGLKDAEKDPYKFKYLFALLHTVVYHPLDSGEDFKGKITVDQVADVEESAQEDRQIRDVMRSLHFRNLITEPAEVDEQKAHQLIRSHRSGSLVTGEFVHLYLSMIKYGEEAEFDAAWNTVNRHFGGIFSRQEMEAIVSEIDVWVEQHPELFLSRWTRVFNEITLYGDDGQEYRIDRLLIDDERKEILIVDYKTGGIADPWQKEKYVELVGKAEQGNYTIRFEYLEVNMSGISLHVN